jgi:polyisoprenoid-binding protein YceI
MNKTRKLLVLGLLPVMMACGGSDEGEDSTEDEVEEVEACTYSYDESSTILTWTAFKTSEKIGVDGSFDQLVVNANESDDMWGVLTAATFEISVSSLNSQNTARDGKLKNSFFGNMEATEMITGTVTDINESEASVDIMMNGMSISYGGDVSVEGETVTMEVVIDILDFNGGIAMDSLGVVCAAKHTGEDGENRLWSDVLVTVKTTLKKNCDS